MFGSGVDSCLEGGQGRLREGKTLALEADRKDWEEHPGRRASRVKALR